MCRSPARTARSPCSGPRCATGFTSVFEAPTPAQRQGWPAIASGQSCLLLAPTGSGKTLAAFLWCIDRLMFEPTPEREQRCRVLYVSPLKALAVDVERNCARRSPHRERRRGTRGAVHRAAHPRRARGIRRAPSVRSSAVIPADILDHHARVALPDAHSEARSGCARSTPSSSTRIHALVPTKRGAHLASRWSGSRRSSTDRSSASACRQPSARSTKIARFLGGAPHPAPDRRGRGAQRTITDDDARPRRGAARSRAGRRGIAGRVAREPGAGRLRDEFAAPEASITYRPVTIVDAGTASVSTCAWRCRSRTWRSCRNSR